MAAEILTEETFEETPSGQARRWHVEFEAARKGLEKWWTQGEKIEKRFRDERDRNTSGESRLNLFSANIQTLRALLYGRTPQVDVGRRFADPNDDVARVAGEMLERMLNADIQKDSDTYATALRHALDDRLLPGMGNCRVRYVAEFGPVQDPTTGQPMAHPETGEPMDQKTYECVEVDYVHWKDQLWSPARTFCEVRWWAFKTPMTREQLVKTFGEDIGPKIPLNSAKESGTHHDAQKSDPWSRADVWEVWDKERKRRWHYVEGYDKVITPVGVQAAPDGSVEDPLELEGFWPFPEPMFANLTTSNLVPTPDFVLAQDLYDEIDVVSTRINLLQRAVKVAGVYDKANDGVKRLLSDSCENILIPVENWALHAERGGLKGVVDWFPLDQVVAALNQLREYRTELAGLLYQVTGMSDIMRGQASTQTTATEQAIKARFASVRIQAFQDEFARFASAVKKLEAEIVSKHFDPQTILERSNIQLTQDAQLAPQAIQLIKSKLYCYRVEVKPDSVSLPDMAALKQERSEFLQSVAGFIQAAMPAAQVLGPTIVLQLLQWATAGFKGAASIEGAIDQAIAQQQQKEQQQAMQPPQQPPPDPKVVAQQMKGQQEQQKIVMEHQANMQRIGAETQGALAEKAADHHFGILSQEAQARLDAIKAVNKVTGDNR